jgi:hypothetical protein
MKTRKYCFNCFRKSIEKFILFINLFILVWYWGYIVNLQKFLKYIIVEFTLFIILPYPPPQFLE